MLEMIKKAFIRLIRQIYIVTVYIVTNFKPTMTLLSSGVFFY
jgi:hypothetical protein